MATVTYDKDVTALLVIDPYNDFISEGGKLWGRLKAVADREMHAALDVNIPNYASAVVTTNQIVDSISFLKPRNRCAVGPPDLRSHNLRPSIFCLEPDGPAAS
jgi:hypothetical protein